MTIAISLTADERTLLLFCLDTYRTSVTNSDSEIDQLIETMHFSRSSADALIEELYHTQCLTASLCEEVSNALWAWKAVSPDRNVPIEPLYAKLCQAAQSQL